MPKRTYQPKKRRRVRVHGFLTRMSTKGGQGRKRLTVTANNHVKKVDWNAVYSVAKSKRGTEGSK
jgi:large subunit ribosomal protein L34